MSKSCCFVLFILISLFTLNQIAISYALTSEDRNGLCDPLEVEAEAEKTAETFELRLKEINGFAPVLAAFIEFRPSVRSERERTLQSTSIAPHGNHVPIYLDERVLRI